MAAITQLGLTGSQRAYGTFQAKATGTAAAQSPRGTRYRGHAMVRDVYKVFILWVMYGAR